MTISRPCSVSTSAVGRGLSGGSAPSRNNYCAVSADFPGLRECSGVTRLAYAVVRRHTPAPLRPEGGGVALVDPQLLEALFTSGLVVDSSPSTRHRAMMTATTPARRCARSSRTKSSSPRRCSSLGGEVTTADYPTAPRASDTDGSSAARRDHSAPEDSSAARASSLVT